MGRGRPRKSLQEHFRDGSFRPERHRNLLERVPTPAEQRAADEQQIRAWLRRGWGCRWLDNLCGNAPEAWKHRAAADAWHHFGEQATAEHIAEAPCSRPAAWWPFDAIEPRDEAKYKQEGEQLYLLGALTDSEIAYAKRQPPELYDLPFRKYWGFWHLHPPRKRNRRQSETAQLVKLDTLSDRERQILDDPKQATSPTYCGHRHMFHYLQERELRLLNLWESHRDFHLRYHNRSPKKTKKRTPK